ncbi:hypothetical protein AT328_004465 [Escherichia coli]|uniref:hypothetical protein n=1 Tax=Escherichia coli TaxID=562 RepID=UPI000BE1F638|nr:hypothetical protein [Escherichia coli]EHD3398671.1 hypothetical protein [Escherichia coli O152]EFK6717069.1 hypothetical protein [Escherichia coli]EFL5693454.1 hypothetical protein [Escherichia coli]EHD3444424.1 hypothetical protein [Escherichia coli O152]EHD3447991.1 hypothetical protein [Escherichia coli O152]
MPKLVTWMNNQRVGELTKYTVVSEIWGLVIVNEHDNHDRQRLDSSLVYIGAHNVYYVKSCLSDAKCFSGSRVSASKH